MPGADQHEQLEQLLDLFVYAPIGLLATGLEALPELTEKGRAKASTARVVGQFTTTMASKQVRDRLSGLEQQLAEVLAIVRDAASPKRPAPTAGSTTEPVHASASEAAAVESVIPGYDSMPATDIIPLLGGLSIDDLGIVEEHERAGRARRTVLNRITQRRAALQR